MSSGVSTILDATSIRPSGLRSFLVASEHWQSLARTRASIARVASADLQAIRLSQRDSRILVILALGSAKFPDRRR
jgi:hypothetical protein